MFLSFLLCAFDGHVWLLKGHDRASFLFFLEFLAGGSKSAICVSWLRCRNSKLLLALSSSLVNHLDVSEGSAILAYLVGGGAQPRRIGRVVACIAGDGSVGGLRRPPTPRKRRPVPARSAAGLISGLALSLESAPLLLLEACLLLNLGRLLGHGYLHLFLPARLHQLSEASVVVHVKNFFLPQILQIFVIFLHVFDHNINCRQNSKSTIKF